MCTRNRVAIQWEVLTYCKLLQNQNRKMKSLWREKFRKFTAQKCQNKMCLVGNETIQLVGMTFLILKYHIKLVFQKDQYHFILKH